MFFCVVIGRGFLSALSFVTATRRQSAIVFAKFVMMLKHQRRATGSGEPALSVGGSMVVAAPGDRYVAPNCCGAAALACSHPSGVAFT